MGCWNETDAITQLPILHRDKVRVFILTKSPSYGRYAGGGQCQSNGTWFPRGLPIQGEYNDYGGLEEDSIIHDLGSKILLDGIKKDWFELEPEAKMAKMMSYSGSDYISANDLTLENLVDCVSQDNAFIHDGESAIERQRLDDWFESTKEFNTSKDKDSLTIPTLDRSPHEDDREKTSLGIMFVLEEVYQSMINFNPIEAHHHKGGWLYKPSFQILCEEATEWYSKASENVKLHDKLYPSESSQEDGFFDLFFSLNSNRFSVLLSHSDPPFRKGISYYVKHLTSFLRKGTPFDDKEVQLLMNKLVEFFCFSLALTAARKSWEPQSGKGSQSYELDIYKILAKTTLNVCKKRDKETRENGDSVGNLTLKKYQRDHNKKELKRLEGLNK